MNPIQRLLKRQRGTEQRAHPSWAALAGSTTLTGFPVDHRAAEGLATPFGCVAVISSSIASLPPYVYRARADGRGRDEDATHPLARLIRTGPNEHQSWVDFVESTLASMLLRGNALIEVEWDRAGRLASLTFWDWSAVSVVLLPSQRLRYDVVDQLGMRGRPGSVRRLLSDDVIHLRDRSDDGLVGRSRLSRTAATIAAASAVQEFGLSMFANGVHPSGVIEGDGTLGAPAMQRLAEMFRKAFTGPRNAAKALILDQGLKWKSISVSPEDAELLNSRRFSAEELARIYGVPPPLVGIWDRSTFTNSETAGRWFATFTLRPWVRKLEAAFTRGLLPPGRELVIDMSGLLRGDEQATYDVALVS